MPSAYGEIAKVLDAARRREGRIVLGAAAMAGAAGALVALLAGIALLGSGVLAARWAAQLTLGLAGIAVVSALAWAAARTFQRAASPAAAARELSRAAPALQSDLLSAVELEEARAEGATAGFSEELVEAHAAATAERARGVDVRAAISPRPLRVAAVALGGAVALHLAALAVAPQAIRAGWRRLAQAGQPASVRRAEPITGDVELTFEYPAYMRRPQRTLSGTGGDLRAPKGTHVTLRTRADRVVKAAELGFELSAAAPAAGPGAPPATQAPGGPSPAAPAPATVTRRAVPLQVAEDGRGLSGGFVVEDPGSYRFRFSDGKRLVAEGPPARVEVELDAPPEARITAPAEEVEVDARSVVHVEWSASDDVGLSQVALLVTPPGGDERRMVVRGYDGASKRDAGVQDLDLAPFRLAEGEVLRYRLEAVDGDTVSGPKKGLSTLHTVKIYSEAEHHRAALARAQALWEDMVRILGDRLETLSEKKGWTAARAAQAKNLDLRTRELHLGLDAAARELRRDRAAPRGFAEALANVAAGLRPLEVNLSSLRGTLLRALSGQGAAPPPLLARVADADDRLDRELEKDVLYLESLLDRQRAEDLVRATKDLANRRRDLADLLDRYRRAPSEEAKKELLAEVARMKTRMTELMRQMSELAKGLSDEHMNQEALAELMKGKDALAGLDEVADKLAKGDVEGAAKALDQLGQAMEGMMASLERSGGRPSEAQRQLMKDALAFRQELADLKGAQEAVQRETEGQQAALRRRMAERMKGLENEVKRLEGLAADARRELEAAQGGAGPRSEDDFAQAHDRLQDLQRALAARDLDAALQVVRRAVPPMQRLVTGLEDDVAMAQRYRPLSGMDPEAVRDAQRHATAALTPARKVKDALEGMMPDPRQLMGPREAQAMGELSRRQGELAQRAGALRQKLEELAQRAPIFPPQAGDAVRGAQGHMGRASGELQNRNPVRGAGEQAQAVDELARLERGMDAMAKRSGGGGGGGGFPMPMPMPAGEPGASEGDGQMASSEKVEIPGADAYKVPDAFRKDLLDAMRQGAPEAYRGEVQRYYEELVK